MKRRKLLIGAGSLAAGGAAALGSSAFTSVNADRTVSIRMSSHSTAQITLEANPNIPDISETGSGELEIDLTGQNGQEVEMDSTYQWGEKANHENQYAFKITNQDHIAYGLRLYHDFNTIPTGNDPSYIKYYIFDGDDAWDENSSEWEYSQAFPDGDDSSEGGDALTRGFSQGKSQAVNSGEAVYVVIEIDTTGADASTSDSLTGDTVIEMEPYV